MSFKVFLGPAGSPGFTKGGTLEGISNVAEIGLNSMEVEFTYGVKMGRDLAKKCGEVAKEKGIRLSCHAPYYVNLCNEKKVEDSMRRILTAADRMSLMGGGVVVFHPGFYGDLGEDVAFELVEHACARLAEKAPEGVFLGLETTGKHSQFGNLDETVRICKSVKGCVPVVDFAHLYARAGGKIDYGKVLDAVKTLKLDVLHSHFSNIEFSDKGEKKHLIVEDNPPFEPLAREVLKTKTSINVICESPILEQDSLKMKKVFEELGHDFK